MLDKRSRRLMDLLLHMCGEDGAYKILEICDLQNGMKQKMDIENLGHIMKFLAAMELVDIKYSDDKVYCIAILPKGRLHEETIVSKKHEGVVNRRLAFLIVLGSFIGAVLGAAFSEVIRSLFQ
ncbi:MAG: hypothetical protein FWE38_01530 [Firmicutes bacterium]|nr:hypothetical protein [Bacillota bacterium]